MRIGIVIGRIGDVDGVALETEKWITVLQRMGHEVFLLSGNYIRPILPPERQAMLRSLSFSAPQCEWEQERAFFFPPDDLVLGVVLALTLGVAAGVMPATQAMRLQVSDALRRK